MVRPVNLYRRDHANPVRPVDLYRRDGTDMAPSIIMLETGLRGGAMALLLLLAIAGWRDGGRATLGRYTVFLDLCAVAYLIESAPTLGGLALPWIAPIRLLSNATPAVFLLWAAAHFDDGFVPAWWRWWPFAGMLALASCAMATDWPPAWRVTHAAALLLATAGIWQTLAGRGADLVEQRRRLRVILAVAAGIWIAGVTVLGATASQRMQSAAGAISAGGILLLALTAALLRLRTEQRDGIQPVPVLMPMPVPVSAMVTSSAPLLGSAGATDFEAEALLRRLQRLMEYDRIYREEKLGIGPLATRLSVPEYRLRRLINQQLGHRNFTSFVNGYRLAEAMAALVDPAQSQVPILTIALDAGFQSIGPFNRAFKAHTGVTPSEFRRDRLNRADAFAAE